MAIQDLRGILQYVPQFRGRTFVVAVDGGVVREGGLSHLVLDLAVLRSLNVQIVLVHGAKAQVLQLAAEQGIELSNDDGRGPTDDATLEIALSAISRMTSDMLSELGVAGLRAVNPNAVTARATGIIDGVEQMHTGRIDKIDAEGLRGLLEQGMLPVIPPLAHNKAARKFRLNSDEVATEVAIALGASKLIFLSEDLNQEGEVKREEALQLTITQALDRGATENLPTGVRSKLKFAARACEGGVARAHVLNGHMDEALLGELFSNEGVGTMVYADEYLTIRPAEAGDVPEMVNMMRGAMEDGQLLGRDASDIEAALDEFFVAVIDGNPVGCIALHLYGGDVAEVACLYIKKSHAARGYGRRLVEFAETTAQEKGINTLFALSTQSYSFFADKLGYSLCDNFPIPPERQAKREISARNARLLLKEIS